MSIDEQAFIKLQDKVEVLEAAVRVSAAMPINFLGRILDRLVDERTIPASVREDVWLMVRDELRTAAIGSELAAGAALAAVPRRRRAPTVAAPLTPPSPRPARDVLRPRAPDGDSDD